MESAAVRDLMWESAGLFRTREGLTSAVTRLDAAYAADLRLLEAAKVAVRESGARGSYATATSVVSAGDWRRLNLITVARLIARAALRREESRGGHFRADFPSRDDLNWKVHLTDKRETYGQ